MSGVHKRVTVLAFVLVIATALVSSAYTLWFEQLTIQATISTTTLDGEIICGTVSDNEQEGWPAPPSTGDPQGEYPEGPLPLKDVATQPTSDGGPGFPHEWVVEVSNAYPGYALDCEVEIENTAPLPWHVENIDITVKECPLPAGPCTTLVPPPPSQVTTCPVVLLSDCYWGNLGIDPPNYPDGLDEWSPIYVEVENWEGCQVHQGQDLEASLFIGVNQSAQENTRYEIILTYQVNQWNESVWNGCNIPKPV